MNCDDIEIYIEKYFLGVLDENQLDSFSHHVAGCKNCAERFAEEDKKEDILIDFFSRMRAKHKNLPKINLSLAKAQLEKYRQIAFDNMSDEEKSLFLKNNIDQAKIYIKDEDYQAALVCLDEARELAPDDEEVREVYKTTVFSLVSIEGAGNIDSIFEEGKQKYFFDAGISYKFHLADKILFEGTAPDELRLRETGFNEEEPFKEWEDDRFIYKIFSIPPRCKLEIEIKG